MAQISAKIDEEQALVILLQKRIKELQVNILYIIPIQYI